MIAAYLFFFAVLCFSAGPMCSGVEGMKINRRSAQADVADETCDPQELQNLKAEFETLKQQQSGGVSNSSEVKDVESLNSRKEKIQQDINSGLREILNIRRSALNSTNQAVTNSTKRTQDGVQSLDTKLSNRTTKFTNEKLRKISNRQFDGHSECSNSEKIANDVIYAAEEATSTLRTCRFQVLGVKSIREVKNKQNATDAEIKRIAKFGRYYISKMVEELDGCGNNVTNNHELLRKGAWCVDYIEGRVTKQLANVTRELNQNAENFVSNLKNIELDYITECTSGALDEFDNVEKAKSKLVDECLLKAKPEQSSRG